MNKWVRLFLAVCLAFASLSLSGCWDSLELNKTSLITGVALEPGKKHKLRLTVETMIPRRPEESEESVPSIVQTMEGDSLPDILVRFNESLDRTLLISHVGVIVIDERLARKGLQHILDPLQRTRFIREDVLVLISEDVHASQIFKVLFPRGKQASSKIVSQLNSYRNSRGGIPQSRLFDVTQGIISEGKELTLCSITLKGSVLNSDKLSSIKSVIPKVSIVIAGAGVFSEDKLLGFINVEESRMVMLADNQVKETTLAISNKEHNVAIRLRKIHSDIQAFMNKGKAELRITLKGEGMVASIDESIDLTKIKGYEQLEKLGSDYLEHEMSRTIRTIQKRFGLDVFGFGEQMYRKHYAQFAPLSGRWNEVFAHTPVTVKASIRLRRSELKTNRIRNEGVGP